MPRWRTTQPRLEPLITGRNVAKLEAAKESLEAVYGLRGLSRVAANEWGKDGVNVNIVCPLAWTAQLENFEAAYPEAFEVNAHMPLAASMAGALHCQARKTRAPAAP